MIGCAKGDPTMLGVFVAPTRMLLSDECKATEFIYDKQLSRSLVMDNRIDNGAVQKLFTPVILDEYAQLVPGLNDENKINTTYYFPIPLDLDTKKSGPSFVLKKFVMSEEIWKFDLDKFDLPENSLLSFTVPLLRYRNGKFLAVGMIKCVNEEVEEFSFFESTDVEKYRLDLAESLLKQKKEEIIVEGLALLHDSLIKDLEIHESVNQPVQKPVEKNYVAGKNIYAFDVSNKLAIKFRIYNLPNHGQNMKVYSEYVGKKLKRNCLHNLYVKTKDKKSWLHIGHLFQDEESNQTIRLHYGTPEYQLTLANEEPCRNDTCPYISNCVRIASNDLINDKNLDKKTILAESDDILFIQADTCGKNKIQSIRGTDDPEDYLGNKFVFYYESSSKKKKRIEFIIKEYIESDISIDLFCKKSLLNFNLPLDFYAFGLFVYVIEGGKELPIGITVKNSDNEYAIQLFSKEAENNIKNIENEIVQLEKTGLKAKVSGTDELKDFHFDLNEIFIKPNIVYHPFGLLVENDNIRINNLGADEKSKREIQSIEGHFYKFDLKKLPENVACISVEPVNNPSELSNKDLYIQADTENLKVVKFSLPQVRKENKVDVIFPWIEGQCEHSAQLVYIKNNDEFKLVGIAKRKSMSPVNYYTITWLTKEIYEAMTK